MSKRKPRSPKARTDPAAMARSGVEAWFTLTTAPPEPIDSDARDLCDLIGTVAQAILANTPADDDATEEAKNIIAHQDAGYMVGLQVGLRLRGAR